MPLFKKKQPTLERRRPTRQEGRPRAFSYHANRSGQVAGAGRQPTRESDSSGGRRRWLQHGLQYLGVIIAVLVIVACLFTVLRLSPSVKIVPLTESSNNYLLHNESVYAEATASILKNSPVNSNKITIDTSSVATQLKQQFPELADVSITLPLLGHRPIVYVQPTKPVFILAASRGQAFVIDNNGRALIDTARADGLSSLNLPVINDRSGLEIQQNDIALPGSDVQFIKEVISQLKAHHVGIKAMSLPPVSSELDVVPAGTNYHVKFNLHSTNPRQQAGAFLAVRQKLQAENTTPASYIDVRVDGRAYYK